MKMLIQKVCNGVIDFELERKRIKSAFRKDKEIKQKLTHLMDLIESEKWEEAEKELRTKWWKCRDIKRECPRREFIGLINFVKNEGFDSYGSYEDLVYAFVKYPGKYIVISKEE